MRFNLKIRNASASRNYLISQTIYFGIFLLLHGYFIINLPFNSNNIITMKTIKILSVTLVLTFSISFAQAQNNINGITSAYFTVKNALASGKPNDASNGAKTLLAALSAPETGLKPDQLKLFNSYAEKLKFDSRHILESTDVNHQREHFTSLSKNLYDVLKGLKLNTSTVYVDYCPMKKAYWLSENTGIKNPYYSDKEMATCGKTTATLAAVK